MWALTFGWLCCVGTISCVVLWMLLVFYPRDFVEIDDVEAICKDMYVMIDFLCFG
jgi:hypothetical protein